MEGGGGREEQGREERSNVVSVTVAGAQFSLLCAALGYWGNWRGRPQGGRGPRYFSSLMPPSTPVFGCAPVEENGYRSERREEGGRERRGRSLKQVREGWQTPTSSGRTMRMSRRIAMVERLPLNLEGRRKRRGLRRRRRGAEGREREGTSVPLYEVGDDGVPLRHLKSKISQC